MKRKEDVGNRIISLLCSSRIYMGFPYSMILQQSVLKNCDSTSKKRKSLHLRRGGNYFLNVFLRENLLL